MDQAELTIDIELSDEFEEMQEILSRVRPLWAWTDIKKKVFTAGITNKICGFYLYTDSKWQDMILVRLYGKNTDLVINRKEERRNMRLLHSIGSGPALYAVLNNALVYGLIPGVTTDTKMIRQQDVWQLTAKEMAKIHSIDLSKCSDVDTSQPSLFGKIDKFLAGIPATFTDAKKQSSWDEFEKTVETIQNEVHFMKQLIVSHGKSPCGFTHNDLLLENIIYNKGENKISFIDYEYGSYNYVYFDIGNHFAEHAGVVDPDHSLHPDRAHIKQWLAVYLPEYSKLCGKGDDCTSVDAISDDVLEEATNQVNLFALCAQLFWGTWSLVQAEHSTIPFDYVGYAKSRLGAYYDRKAEFTAFIVPN